MTADATIADPQASTSLSTLVDEITRRSIEHSISELGPPPCPLTWFALGSHGRREPAPGSDIDSALAWDGDEDDERARSYMLALGLRVSEALALEGYTADDRGASAGGDLFNRSVSGWRRLIRGSIEDPTENKGLIVISLFLDGRVLHREGGEAPDLEREFEAAQQRSGLLRLMLRLALAQRPAVGRLREFALERSGEYRGRLDIKHGGLLPVTTIARYASLAAGAIASRLDARAPSRRRGRGHSRGRRRPLAERGVRALPPPPARAPGRAARARGRARRLPRSEGAGGRRAAPAARCPARGACGAEANRRPAQRRDRVRIRRP